MAIVPTAFHADGSIDVFHDDPGFGHAGTVSLSAVRFQKAFDGVTDIEQFVLVDCPAPGCGSTSTWPASGGSHPVLGQTLHLFKQVQGKGKTFAAAKVRVALLAAQLDGPSRFRLTRAARQQLETGAPLDIAAIEQG